MGLGSSRLQRSPIDIPHTVPVVPDRLLNDDKTATVPLRNASHPDSLVQNFVDEELHSAYDAFQRGRRISGNRGFLGQRRRVGGQLSAEYDWWTYNEVARMAHQLGSSLVKKGCVNWQEYPGEVYKPAQRLRCIGISSRNRVEWFILEQAANYYGVTIIPLYDTLGDQAVQYMLAQTQLTCVAGGDLNLKQYFKMLKMWREGSGAAASFSSSPDNVRTALSFDPVEPSLAAEAKELDIELYYWQDLLKEAADGGPLEPPSPPKRENVSTICYSSGTTGRPKGIIITHGAIAANICGAVRGLAQYGVSISEEDTYMSYLPLAHVFERMVAHVFLAIGGKIAIYSGEPRLLLEDVKLAKPTVFASVPRLFMRINDTINTNISEQSAVARYLFHLGMETKLERLRKDGSTTHPIWDRILFNKVKSLMGSNVRYMLIGGAASDVTIQEKMAVLFCCPLLEGYGLTETLGTTFIRRSDDCLYGHIGGCLPCNEMKLVSIPEMKYQVSGPGPAAGEIWIRGNTVTPGYFLNREEYNEAVEYEKDDPRPWFKTGDIAVRLPAGGRIKIIDRRKNLFKMSQGEYISPERIEGIYLLSPVLSQVFVYGDSKRNSLVGIVYLNDSFIMKQGGQFGIPKERLEIRGEVEVSEEKAKNAPPERIILNMEELKLGQNKALRTRITQELEDIAQENGLKGFEKIKNWRFGHEGPNGGGFSVENGQITPTHKYKRNVITDCYRRTFEVMYKELGEWYDQDRINQAEGTGNSP